MNRVFKTFAKYHPAEAYKLKPNDFCNLINAEGFNLTNEQINIIFGSLLPTRRSKVRTVKLSKDKEL
jgi:hypothetical protein